MTSTLKLIEIHIFCERSKIIGGGHYIRSNRLFNLLKKTYKTYIHINLKEKKILKILNNKKKKILFFDYQNYKKKNYVNSKKNYYFFFDTEKNLNIRSTNICPLIFKNKKFYGPKWLVMPNNIIKKGIAKKIKNILILQGLTDAKNNAKKIETNKFPFCEIQFLPIVPLPLVCFKEVIKVGVNFFFFKSFIAISLVL